MLWLLALIVALGVFTIFTAMVTNKGLGQGVSNHLLRNYSKWLEIADKELSQRLQDSERKLAVLMPIKHPIYTSSSCEKVDKEDSWYLEPYQKHQGQASTFVTHIEKGVEIAAKDGATLLLFSGGETRKDAGPRSEAQSYWAVAESKQWFGAMMLVGRIPLHTSVPLKRLSFISDRKSLEVVSCPSVHLRRGVQNRLPLKEVLFNGQSVCYHRKKPLLCSKSDGLLPVGQGRVHAKKGKNFEQWDSLTAKFAGAANLPFLLLQLPQMILNT